MNRSLCALGVMVSLIPGASALASATFQGIGGLFGPGSRALAVSADGTTVVGDAGGPTGVTQAVYWRPGTGMVGLGQLFDPPRYSYATGVSGDGSVIVGVAGGIQPFIWTNSTGMVPMSGMSPTTSDVAGLSADGTAAVGTSLPSTPGPLQATRWTQAGGPQALGIHPTGASSRGAAISADGSTVVGWGDTGTGFQAARWRAETGFVSLRPVPGTWSQAFAVSGDGAVVTGMMDATTTFRWTEATGMVPIGPGQGNGISADGNVIVGAAGGSQNSAFFWTPESGMVNLKAFLLANGATGVQGWNLSTATAVSADGRVVVGHGLNALGQVEGFYATIPAPAAWVTIGAAGLIAARRRR